MNVTFNHVMNQMPFVA